MPSNLKYFVNGQLPPDLVSRLEEGISVAPGLFIHPNFGKITTTLEAFVGMAPQLGPLYDLIKKGYDEVYCFDGKEDKQCLRYGLFRSIDGKSFFTLEFLGGPRGIDETKMFEEKIGLDLRNEKIRDKDAYKSGSNETLNLAAKYSP